MPQQSADLLPSYCTKVLVCVCYHLGRVLKINFFCFQFLQRQIIIWLLNRRTGRLDIYLQLYFKLLFYKKLYFIPSRTTSLLVEERLPARDYHANFINGFGDVLKNQLQTFRHFHLHKLALPLSRCFEMIFGFSRNRRKKKPVLMVAKNTMSGFRIYYRVWV